MLTMTSRMRWLTAALVLVAQVAFWPAAAADTGQEETPDRAAMHASLQTALDEGRLDQALELAEQIAFAEQTEYFDALVQVVAILCRKGDKEAAVETVQAALDAGFWDYRRLLQDDSLALINADESFREMVRAAWAKQYIKMLERPSRDDMQKPAEVMAALAFKAGERVADVGAGSGYFTVPVARAVGTGGRVWAVDIRQTMLDFIRDRLTVEGLANVELLLAKPDDPMLPAGGVDTILMVDTIHYVRDRAAYGRKLAAALAPGGRLVVIDFRWDPDAEREFAPPLEQQVKREDLDADLATAGFVPVESHDFLPEQYFVVYRLTE